MVDLGCAHSPWCCCAQALQGCECSCLWTVHAVNTLLQMRCSRTQWFGQKEKWDSRPRKQSWSANVKLQPVLAKPHRQGANGRPNPSPISLLSSVLHPFFSLFTFPASQSIPGGNSLHPSHPSSPSPWCSCCSWHIPASLFFFLTKRDMFGGFLYIPVLQICTLLSWHGGQPVKFIRDDHRRAEGENEQNCISAWIKEGKLCLSLLLQRAAFLHLLQQLLAPGQGKRDGGMRGGWVQWRAKGIVCIKGGLGHRTGNKQWRTHLCLSWRKRAVCTSQTLPLPGPAGAVRLF